MQNIDHETVPSAKGEQLPQPGLLRRMGVMHKGTHQRAKPHCNHHRAQIPEEPQEPRAWKENRLRQIPAEYLIVHAIKHMHNAVRNKESRKHECENQKQRSPDQKPPALLRHPEAQPLGAEKLFRAQTPARRKERKKRCCPLPAKKIFRKRNVPRRKSQNQCTSYNKPLPFSLRKMSADRRKNRQQTIPARQRQKIPRRAALRQKPKRRRAIGQAFHRIKQELIENIIEKKASHLVPAKALRPLRTVPGQKSGHKNKGRHMKAVNPEEQRPCNFAAPAERVEKMTGHHQNNQYALEDVRLRKMLSVGFHCSLSYPFIAYINSHSILSFFMQKVNVAMHFHHKCSCTFLPYRRAKSAVISAPLPFPAAITCSSADHAAISRFRRGKV